MSEEAKPQIEEKPDAGHRLFISYSHADAEPASALRNLCKQRGLDVWLDKNELQAGENWKAALDAAVSKSDIFLILLSEHLSRAQETPREWSSICERRWSSPNVRLVPIRLDAVEPPSFLRDAKYIDALDNQGLVRCAAEIERLSQLSGTLAGDVKTGSAEKSEAVARFRSLLDAVSDSASANLPLVDPSAPK